MPYPVVKLIEGRSEPISVRPTDSAQRALSLMIEYDFGQLPVIDEAKKPIGMITHDSILRALSNFGMKLEELRVANAIVKAQTYRPRRRSFRSSGSFEGDQCRIDRRRRRKANRHCHQL